jgi:MarR family transcriptional regulator, lower aerobic nicotinate degradation pathway regulator
VEKPVHYLFETSPAEAVSTRWTSVLVIKLADQLRQRFGEALKPHDLQPKHFEILYLLKYQGDLSQVELGRHTETDRAPMVHLIDHLESLGFAERTAHTSDRRVKTIKLTEQGHQIADQTLELAIAVQSQMFAPLSADEQQLFATLLARVITQSEPPVG